MKTRSATKVCKCELAACVARPVFAYIAAVGVLCAGIGCKGGGPESFSAASEVFHRHCMPCHAADKKTGGLSLQSVAGIKKGGVSGPAVVPGDVTGSLLTKRLRGLDGKKVMPPNVGPIDEEDIKVVETWIKAGTKE